MEGDPRIAALDHMLELLTAALFAQGPADQAEGLRNLILATCPAEARAHMKDFLIREAGREAEFRAAAVRKATAN